MSGWVYTDDYYNVNGEGFLWSNAGYPYGSSMYYQNNPGGYNPESLDIWDYYGYDLGADTWFWYDDCRSYTDQCG